MNRSGIAYDAVLALHIVSGFVGFSAMGLTGFFGAQARNHPDAAPVQRYFRPGTNWASRAVFVVPIAGLALIYMGASPGQEAGRVWTVVGVVMWCAAAGMAAAVLWPAERRIQEVVAKVGKASALGGGDRSRLNSACRQVAWSAAFTDVLYVAAMVVMVAKPGGG